MWKKISVAFSQGLDQCSGLLECDGFDSHLCPFFFCQLDINTTKRFDHSCELYFTFFRIGITANHFGMYLYISKMIWLCKSRKQLDMAPDMTKLSWISHHLKMTEYQLFFESSLWWKLSQNIFLAIRKWKIKFSLLFISTCHAG